MRRVPQIAALVVVVLTMTIPTPARAQHGDWLLGTLGLLSAQQPPEGILYQNLWSYYHASNNGFLTTGLVKCGPLSKLCLGANFNTKGSLDLFVDQNIFWLVPPFKIPFIGATYGALVDVPFAIADASAGASIQPALVFNGFRSSGTLLGPTLETAGGATKGSIADIYFEPINLGWYFKQVDAMVRGGSLPRLDRTTRALGSISAMATGPECWASVASCTLTANVRGHCRSWRNS
jgi:hypothetical protein